MANVTTLTVALGKSKHVIIRDTANVPVDPTLVSWSGDMADIVSRTVDGTGFNFHGSKVGSVDLVAVVNGDPASASDLTVTVTSSITGLLFDDGA